MNNTCRGFGMACLIVLGCARNSSAQFSIQNVIKHYNLKDGLSQGVVNSITEDSQSFIWFATDDGLNRFDGYNFRVFKKEEDVKDGIVGNFVQSLFKDSDGVLWVSSRGGLQKFNPDLEAFEVYRHNPEGDVGPSLNDVSFITEGAKNNLWLALYANGFASFDKSAKKFIIYNSSNLSSLSSDMTMCLLEDPYGLLWVGTQDGGLTVFRVKGGRIMAKVDELSNPRELTDRNIKSIVKDRNGNIWIGTSRGLVVYVRDRNAFFNFNSSISLGGLNITSLLSDSNEILWISAQNKGIYRLDLRQMDSYLPGQMKFSKVETLHEFDISNTTIQSFYEDGNKNIWAGTHGDGVYLISNEKERFMRFQKLISKGSTFTSVDFHGMCYDKEGNLWLGSNGHGIYRKNMVSNSETHYLADNRTGSLKDNVVLSALCDSKGRLWFGTYRHGIFEFNKVTNSFQHYKYVGAARAGANDVRVIFEDSKNNIWVGTNRGGLCLLKPGTGTYSTPGHFSAILKDGDIRSISEDKSGNLWLGFYGDGLYKFGNDSKSLVPYFQNKQEKRFIDSRIILALNCDVSGHLWIGTGGDGLFVYDPEKDSLQRITEEQGLGNNTIYSIQVDQNTGWVSTNSGISKIETPSSKVVSYRTVDGLQDGQFNPASGLFNAVAGYMCFGGTGGLNIFYPSQVEEIDVRPKVVIMGLQLFNKPVSIRDTAGGRPILRRAINKTAEISLAHDQSVITFEFIGLNYSFPEKTNYAYKLENLDRNWNFVGHQRTATYRYLKPGNYEFKVKASSDANGWSNEYTSIRVTINPPIWGTLWAYATYSCMVLILGIVGYRISRKQISLRRRLRIEKAQRKHERRMAADKFTFFTEVSHEFRTPLTLIMGPILDMLSKEDSQSPNSKKLQMVHRNANKLLNLINKLIDYRKIETGNVVLKVRESDMVSFLKEIFDSFQVLAVEKNIKYTFQTDLYSMRMWFDHERLEMVFNNILSNAFKYIGSGNEITVLIGQEISESYLSGKLVVEVRDNGIGIPKRYLGSIFDWFYKGDSSGSMNSGIGLSLARKLVHLHKGEIFVKSVEGYGSTFSVKLPLGKQHFNTEDVTFIIDTQNELENLGDEKGTTIEDDAPTKRGIPSLLVIEDDEEIRLFLRGYFEGNYKILEAANGNDGLDIANTAHPDLIISDIMMPDKDGIEVCKVLKDNIRTSHIPIILLSAKASLNDHKRGIETGADAYITKPFSPDILSLTVNNLLQSRSQLMRFYRNFFVNDRNDIKEENKVNSPDEVFLQTLFDHLKANIEKPEFNIAELSDMLNMSRSLVYKKIKMLTGLSPTDYIRSLRMQEAAKLLQTQRYKVFEVVYMVGFSDLKYFRECFSKEFGKSPSDYMKSAHDDSIKD